MGLFPQLFIDDLKAQADIVQVVQDYVPLKKAGNSYKGLCPFHSEKTPSFHVHRDKGFFHCFGCGVGGDVLKFLELQEKLGFQDAVRQLAQRFGVEVPEPNTERDAAAETEREAMLGAHDAAAEFFRSRLADAIGRPAREHLDARDVTPETTELLGLGFAPPTRDSLIRTNPLSFASQLAQVPSTGDPTTDNDAVPDPEMPRADLEDIVVYVRELAGPQPLPMDSVALRGEALFSSMGCGKCHIENLATTGAPINAYTDLLLHDMGPQLADGIVMSHASGSEFRTQPLWGLRHHATYLHDGRADTIEAAILAHAGEGQASRDSFNALAAADRAAVLSFLETR